MFSKREFFAIKLLLALCGLCVAGCSGSSSDPAADLPAESGGNDPMTTHDDLLQSDVEVADVSIADDEFDSADLILTEIDRQWSCEITSESSVYYEDIYFSPNGSAFLSARGTWYWNRSLPAPAFNLHSDTYPSMRFQNISSSNTFLEFDAVVENGLSESYSCVMITREVQS